MKEILLRLSSEEYNRLKWISDKLGLSISDCLRSFIPKINPPEAKIVKEHAIDQAKFDDLVPIKELSEKDKKQLREYLNELFKHEPRWALTLATEIKQQILDEAKDCLTVNTYKRLARWISPYRWTKREQYVKKRAQAISRILFGREIERLK